MSTAQERYLGGNAPTPFALGDAPEPATFPEAKKPRANVKPSATHTGTDPQGRAVGPAEDHTKLKRDVDGLSVKEGATRAQEASR
ncbi:hypothetical protein GCM10027596_26740 [Nocardioides korecus]